MSFSNKSLLFLVGLIPTMLIVLLVSLLIKCVIEQSAAQALLFIAIIYLLPPMLWRLLRLFIPAKMGASYLGKNSKTVNGWFVSYQIQQIYNALPFLEALLKLIPGAYSAWLRLWGARIGKSVNWTCQSKIVDRPFIHIGDRCLIGNEAYLSAHAIKKKDDRYLLYLKEITIGSDVVLSLQSIVGPGAVIGDRAFISARAAVHPNQHIKEGQLYDS